MTLEREVIFPFKKFSLYDWMKIGEREKEREKRWKIEIERIFSKPKVFRFGPIFYVVSFFLGIIFIFIPFHSVLQLKQIFCIFSEMNSETKYYSVVYLMKIEKFQIFFFEFPKIRADIALVGLAVMGQNLILNMADSGFKVFTVLFFIIVFHLKSLL